MPGKGKKSGGTTKIDALKHKDKRANIPTRELRDFVKGDEDSPRVMLYPRDPSLDPQLVWKGKDEQDAADLAVPVVPVYIQEKIHPQAIVEDIRAQAQKGKPAQADLFSDFNGLSFEQQIDFYKHEANWANRMILGDSSLVMTSLAEKEGLKGKVQMIYFDPPYGINFGSNWQVSTRRREIKDGKAEDATRQPEQIKAFRDTWKLGIHSYLAYLRDRLVISRGLLTESGSICIQIGDENVHLVRCILDEVFGCDNFITLISFVKTSGFTTTEIARDCDYILWYAKNRAENIKARPLFVDMLKKPVGSGYNWLVFDDGSTRRLSNQEIKGEASFPENGILFKPDNILSQGAASEDQTFQHNGKSYSPGPNSHWKANFPEGMRKLAFAKRLHVSKNTIQYIRHADDFPLKAITSIWTDTITGQFTEDKIYVVQTNTKVIERCILMTTDPGDLVLDPTCGSGTTAYVAEQWGRRWITIDTSRVALALARTRLMSGRYPYYLLSDSEEGLQKEAEITRKNPPTYKTGNDIRKGFVYKRVPHVTLKSIANNPDIREGMTREEIDRAIAKHADRETLYDQPYEDGKRVRVSGPFTVESLSPHRVLSPDQERPDSEGKASEETGSGQFEAMILENLKKAGVQNTFKNERLKFERLESYAGQWLHGSGEFADAEGKNRRVAVCIGPEHGTVGPELVKEAAKEAVKGVGFDILVVCGFAFDPHVSEETKRYGALTVLPARMNPDLSMGDELLKKTGAGNLFMVFGEPDIEVKKGKDGKIALKLNGVDVYDPTTGEVRSGATNDIACWFIDTDYNGESFFVRHAYFTSGDEPYEKLKRALRAEIDEGAWAALYRTESRPFDPPKTGKIAVKAINHYGDEVLKVYEVPR